MTTLLRPKRRVDLQSRRRLILAAPALVVATSIMPVRTFVDRPTAPPNPDLMEAMMLLVDGREAEAHAAMHRAFLGIARRIHAELA